MAMKIKPFRAFRFNKEVVGDPARCIAPPYDVITAGQQKELYNKSDYNVVRLIKGRQRPGDSDENNQYTRAAEYLRDWIDSGALRKDESEGIYGYIQDFELAGTRHRRLSFIAMGRLEEFGKTVRPHEETLEKPKIDRLRLNMATGAGLGLVFMLYDDDRQIAETFLETQLQKQPLLDLTDESDVRHRLFAISDPRAIQKMTRMMADKECIIADGHHRYETGLNYYRQMGKLGEAYQMMAFSNIRDDGFVLLPTHRIVKGLNDFDARDFLQKLGDDFELKSFEFSNSKGMAEAKTAMFSFITSQEDKAKCAFGIYAGEGAFYAAVLTDESVMNEVASDKSSGWKSLSVSVLHKLVLDRQLGISDEDLASGENVEYVKDTGDGLDNCVEKIDSGDGQLVFFLTPVRLEQLKAVTKSGEKMPQKSTFFYPKMYSGLTISEL